MPVYRNDDIEIFDEWEYRGQVYVCVDIEPHTRRDGKQTYLAHVASCCVDCGEKFITRISIKARKIDPVRRCETCRELALARTGGVRRPRARTRKHLGKRPV